MAAFFEISGYLGRGVGRSPAWRPAPFPLGLGAAAGVPSDAENVAQALSTWPAVKPRFVCGRGLASQGRQAGITPARASSS